MVDNLPLRILAFFVFVAGIAGASFVAYDLYGPEDSVSASGSATTVAMLPGGTGQTTIPLQNFGARSVNVTAESATDGFTVTSPTPAILAGGSEGNLVVQVATSRDVEPGRHTVQVKLLGPEGNTFGTARLTVEVIAARAPTLEITPLLPAAVAGTDLAFTYTIENVQPVSLEATVNVTAGDATVSPDRLTLGPNQQRTGTITLSVPDDASGVVGVTAEARLVEHDAVGSASAEVPVAAPGTLHVSPIDTELVVSPGNTVSIPVVFVWAGDVPANLSVSASDGDASVNPEALDGAGAGSFVEYEVPGDASLPMDVELTFTVDGASATATVTLQPTAGDTAGVGDTAHVNYVGRLDDGSIFDTSRYPVASGPFAKFDTFRLRGAGDYNTFQVQLGPNAGTIPGFWQAIDGMGLGETKTVRLAPEDAYGPAVQTETVPATTEIPREESGARAFPNVQRQLIENPQTGIDLSDKQVGDQVTLDAQGGVPITYEFEITRLDETTVDLLWLVEEGQAFTFFPMWPNGTVVAALNETSVTFRTTPTTTGPDERFTWADTRTHPHAAGWTNATYVESVDDEAITLRHAPDVGLQYSLGAAPGQRPSTYTVEDVGDQEITVSSPNPSPLGGLFLTFDITLVDVSTAAGGPSP